MSDEIIVIDEKEIQDFAKKNNITSMHTMEQTGVYKPITLKCAMDEVDKPREIVVHPILPKQEILFLYAATGAGKTMFTLNLAYAIANGGSFLRYSVPLPRKVLYIDGEMAYSELKSRLHAIQAEQGELFDPDYFHIMTPDKMVPDDAINSIPLPMPKIDNPAGQDLYFNIIQKYGIDVVIFDNYSTLSTCDESSNTDWAMVQEFLSRIKASGRTIIFIHHAGKGGSYRGTSRMLDIMNTAIKLEAIESDVLEADVTGDLRIKICYEKNRSFYGRDAMSFEANYRQQRWSHRSIENTLMQMIVEKVGLGTPTKEIASEVKKSVSQVNRLIAKAKKEGLLR